MMTQQTAKRSWAWAGTCPWAGLANVSPAASVSSDQTLSSQTSIAAAEPGEQVSNHLQKSKSPKPGLGTVNHQDMLPDRMRQDASCTGFCAPSSLSVFLEVAGLVRPAFRGAGAAGLKAYVFREGAAPGPRDGKAWPRQPPPAFSVAFPFPPPSHAQSETAVHPLVLLRVLARPAWLSH
uniref:Uncharacterized protein n=1 Tax=Myotis myotis TaxID=51298 RepID=A0A7J7XH52_MYOMY|nr:hypothetical protein mMyoMyo1_011589 [Myotis myotis]